MRGLKTTEGKKTPFALLAPILIIAIAVLGIIFFTHASYNPAAQGQTSPTTESWTLAKGLPSQVTGLAFSAADPTRGYAAAFVNKQTQNIYTTTDYGATWRQAGTVQGPVGDILSTDPLDSQDVVILTVYAPAPGAYTFQRSFDGGQTWSSQTTDLTTTGEISQTGWSDSTFLVGFQLDGQLQGSSAVVAFPKGQPSVHLDVNGKINGTAIPHLRLLTGRHGKIAVWGDAGTTSQNPVGVATTDFGGHWTSLPSTIQGTQFIPAAASADGSVVVATSTDNTKIAVSSDGGDTWGTQPPSASAPSRITDVFITATSKAVIIACSDGAYTLRNGAWGKVTSKQIAFVSDNGLQHAARLWAYDSKGLVIWLDD